jgi:hypothetical protein
MAMEKSLYAAPRGIMGDEEPGPELELEIENPDRVTLDDGSVEITLIPGDKVPDENGIPFDANLAEYLSEGVLSQIASDLIDDYENDLRSRAEWEKTYTEGIKLLGLRYEERIEPWPGACGVHSPLIAEAAVRFQAEAIMETFPASGPVRTKIIGDVTPAKTQAAARVAMDMNYELTEVMKEYRSEHERMLWTLVIAGSAFKKVYYDPELGRQTSMFIPPEDVILPYGASEISLCERITHRMRKTPNQIRKLQESGYYLDFDVPDTASIQSDPIQNAKDREVGYVATFDDRPLILEVQTEYCVPGFDDKDDEDGDDKDRIGVPYVISIIKDTGKVLSIYRNWEPDAKDNRSEFKQAEQYFVHYQYVPGYGAYGLGLLHLIGNSAKSATSITRQLVDAGTLSNLPGGMKTRGLRIKGDDTPIAPGEFRDVDVSSGALRDNIMPLPYKEPSQVLLGLREIIVNEAQKFSAAPDMKISDMSANAPVGTTLALIERNLKVMSAVQARMHFAMKQELKLLAKIILKNTSNRYDYDPENAPRRARKSDYSYVEIIPVSDPNASTLAQRVVQYQAVVQLAQSAPQIYDLPRLHRQMLEVLNIKDADKLVRLEDDLKPIDPVTENMNVLMGKPVKAFIEQNHKAHIGVHMAAMQDPHMMQIMGQNPQAQALLAAAYAHVTEHVAMEYKVTMEQQMGMAMPDPKHITSPETADQIAMKAAQVSQQILQQHTQETQQQKAQQQSQDPIIQMQQEELKIKAQEVQIKGQQAQVEAMVAQAKIQLDRDRLAAEQQRDGIKLGIQTQQAHDKSTMEQHKEGVRMGLDVIKQHTQHQHETNKERVAAQQTKKGVTK